MANLTIANAPNGALAGTSLAASHKLPTSGDYYITADELINGMHQLQDVYRVNSEAELTSAIAGAKNTILIDGDITLTGNHTVTQDLIIRNGAVITTDSNTLTINGQFSHGASQCFSGSGVTFGLISTCCPEW